MPGVKIIVLVFLVQLYRLTSGDVRSCYECSYSNKDPIFEGRYGNDINCVEMKNSTKNRQYIFPCRRQFCKLQLLVVTSHWAFVAVERSCALDCYSHEENRGYGHNVKTIELCCESDLCNDNSTGIPKNYTPRWDDLKDLCETSRRVCQQEGHLPRPEAPPPPCLVLNVGQKLRLHCLKPIGASGLR